MRENNGFNKKKQCSVTCPYFPDMSCDDWEYDDKLSYIKRRKEKKEFICNFDGHKIKSWYDKCPLKE